MYNSPRENTPENPIKTCGKCCSAPTDIDQIFFHSVCSEIHSEQNQEPPSYHFPGKRIKMVMQKRCFPPKMTATRALKQPAPSPKLSFPIAYINKIFKSLKKNDSSVFVFTQPFAYPTNRSTLGFWRLIIFDVAAKGTYELYWCTQKSQN